MISSSTYEERCVFLPLRVLASSKRRGRRRSRKRWPSPGPAGLSRSLGNMQRVLLLCRPPSGGCLVVVRGLSRVGRPQPPRQPSSSAPPRRRGNAARLGKVELCCQPRLLCSARSVVGAGGMGRCSRVFVGFVRGEGGTLLNVAGIGGEGRSVSRRALPRGLRDLGASRDGRVGTALCAEQLLNLDFV